MALTTGLTMGEGGGSLKLKELKERGGWRVAPGLASTGGRRGRGGEGGREEGDNNDQVTVGKRRRRKERKRTKDDFTEKGEYMAELTNYRKGEEEGRGGGEGCVAVSI